jgi:hypothetical protein
MKDTVYSATSTAWGGRRGRVLSTDGRVDLQLSSPKEMGGDDGPGTNPEQLFAREIFVVTRSNRDEVSDGEPADAVATTARRHDQG